MEAGRPYEEVVGFVTARLAPVEEAVCFPPPPMLPSYVRDCYIASNVLGKHADVQAAQCCLVGKIACRILKIVHSWD